MNMQAALMSSNSAEWYTPPELEHMIRRSALVGDKWSLDPCADPGRLIPAEEHWTIEDNAMIKTFRKHYKHYVSVFINPPYGRQIGKWVDRFNARFSAGTDYIQAWLVPARTDTQWFQSLVSAPCVLVFLRGRVKFHGPNGSTNPAPFPSAVVLRCKDVSRLVKMLKSAREVLENDVVLKAGGW